MNELKRLITRATWVSLDIFDTAVIRTLKQPTDLFTLVEARLKSGGQPLPGFAAARVAAETRARAVSRLHSGREDIGLREIYAQLGRDNFPSGPLKRALREEIRLELLCSKTNPEIKALYDHALDLGKGVVFISDMYLPQALMERILRRRGYGRFAHLFLSSRHYRTKHHGNLYRVALKRLGCHPEELLHIGDNLHADVHMARRQGITAYHYQKPAAPGSPPPRLPRGAGLASGSRNASLWAVWQGLNANQALHHPRDNQPDYWYSFGYRTVGMLLLGLGAWVVERARELGLEALYFMARDALALKRVVDLLLNRWGLNLETRYLLASRRAFIMPTITYVDQHALDFLIPDTQMRVAEYLKRAGLAGPRAQDAISKHFPSPQTLVATREDRQRLAALWGELEPELVAAAREERQPLLTYLRSQRLFGRPVGLVDVGWSCTSQAALKRLANLAGEPLQAMGLYLGIFEWARRYLPKKEEARGYLHAYRRPARLQRQTFASVEILEFCLTAAHGSLVRFREQNGKVVPELEALDEGERQRAGAARRLQQGAMAFIRDFLDAWPETGPFQIDPRLAWSGLWRLISRPAPVDLEHLGSLNHRRFFGVAQRSMILPTPARAPGETWRWLYRLFQSYGDSWWRFGFFRQVSLPLRLLLAPVHWCLYLSPFRFGGHLAIIRRRFGFQTNESLPPGDQP